jgi:small subunit ribosomal protein S19
MAKEKFSYRGKTLEELKTLSLNEFAELLHSRARRNIKRGFSEKHQKLREQIKIKNNVKTHLRDMIVLPEMIGKTVRIHDGHKFEPVVFKEEAIGHLFGEFVLTRKKLKHNKPGVGATKSTANISLK